MEYDPLVESDALLESQLLDVRVHVLTGSAAALFEMRTSLQFDRGNAGVLVLRGASSASWNLGGVRPGVIAYTVMQSRPFVEDGLFHFEVRLHPKSRVLLSGAAAEFYLVDVDGIGETPPDYAQDVSVIGRGVPSWKSSYDFIEGSTRAGRQ